MKSRRYLLLAILTCSGLLYGASDPPVRLLLLGTAAAILFSRAGANIKVPKPVARATSLFFLLVGVQLIPLPKFLRDLIQPGLAKLNVAAWYPSSAAPWNTVMAAASALLPIFVMALAARIAISKAGSLWVIRSHALAGAILSLAGLASEQLPPGVMLFGRASPEGSTPYGSFVNPNHFAMAMELTLPAAAALLLMGVREAVRSWPRNQAPLGRLAFNGTLCFLIGVGLLRCGSAGGTISLILAWIVTSPLWVAQKRRVVALALVVVMLVGGVTSLVLWGAKVKDELIASFLIGSPTEAERVRLWIGAAKTWLASPLIGVGLGAFPHVFGAYSPPTGARVALHAHNDWLEWGAETGIAGAVLAIYLVVIIAKELRSKKPRRLPHHRRYLYAAATTALVSCAVHESFAFGLHSLSNLMLAASLAGFLLAEDGESQMGAGVV